MSKYKVGDIIQGNVTGIENYGIFVSINNEYTGLIHISEISDGYVRNINDYVVVGDVISVKIIEIDENSKHFKLSIKGLNYKDKDLSKIEEGARGFDPLKEKLPEWVEEKLKEYE